MQISNNIICLDNKTTSQNSQMQHFSQPTSKRSLSPFILMIITVLISLCISLYFYSHSPPSIKQSQQWRNLYTTNTTRLQIVTDYCSTEQSTKQITATQKETNQHYKSTMSSYFKANSTRLFGDLINQNFGSALEEIQINGIGTLIFMIPYLIGLAIAAIMWPCLLCCCLCQEDCPVQCCRDKNPKYSSFEVNWPTAFQMVMCLLLIAVAIPAMTSSKDYFTTFNCQVSKFIDNFLHGNTTADSQHFFAGVTTVQHQLGNVMVPNLPAIKVEVAKLKGTEMDTLNTNAQAALTDMQTMPNGGNTSHFVQSYNYPIESSVSTSTLSSKLSTELGIYTETSSSIGELYTYVELIKTNMTTIKDAAASVQPHLVVADIGVQITTTNTALGKVEAELDTMQTQIKNVIDYFKTFDNYSQNYAIMLYAVILTVSILLTTSIIFLKCFNFSGCRYLLYFLCMIVFFICLITFMLAIVTSIMLPSLYYSCDYINEAIKTPDSFTKLMDLVGGDSYSNTTAYFKECFGGDNDFMLYINPTLKGYLNNLEISTQNSAVYDFSTVSSTLTTKLTNTETLIDTYGKGQLPDFTYTTGDGQTQISYFNQVAAKTLYTSSCPSGSYSLFYTDVWAPSIASGYTQLVPCGGKLGVNSADCPSGITSCPTSRCIDTFSLLQPYLRSSTTGNIVNDTDTRYGSCTDFNTYIDNFLTNYVTPVDTKIGNSVQDNADTSKLAGRYAATKALTTTFQTYLTGTIQPIFTEVETNLATTANSATIFEPHEGLLSGLDCRLISEDFQNTADALCITTLNNVYFTMVVLGIIAFALLFSSCCIICMTVRDYRSRLQKGMLGEDSKKGIIPLENRDSPQRNRRGRQKLFPLDESSQIKIMG